MWKITKIVGQSQQKIKKNQEKGVPTLSKKRKKESPTNFLLVFSSSFPKNERYKKKNTDSRERRKIVVQYFPVELQTLISNTIIFLN